VKIIFCLYFSEIKYNAFISEIERMIQTLADYTDKRASKERQESISHSSGHDCARTLHITETLSRKEIWVHIDFFCQTEKLLKALRYQLKMMKSTLKRGWPLQWKSLYL
jgi:hypothetical protein